MGKQSTNLHYKPVTLKDIAQKTGYTVNTVSRALKNKADISPATCMLIQKTAKEMGYIGNAVASSLRSGKTKTIAIIVADASNPYFSIIIREFEQAARTRDYATFILNSNEESESEKQAILLALSKNVDGILICPSQKSIENIRILQRANRPFVLLGRHLDDKSMDYVICDDDKGGYIATTHLLALGHRDILFLNAHHSISSARERLQGYRRAFAEMGVEVNPELIREVAHLSGGCRSVLQHVIDSRLPFTAIFAFSDLIAWEAVYTLDRNNLRVPEDISVVGFDNIQSRFFFPFPLTTVSSSKGNTSLKAFEILLKKIERQGDVNEYFHEIVDPTLVVRKSTMPMSQVINRH